MPKNRFMFSNLTKRANLLKKYDVGETVKGLAKKLGKDPSQILKLNSNENFFIPLDFLRGLLSDTIKEFDPRIYPRDEFYELRRVLAENIGFSQEQIVIGAGSDQLIELLCKAILEKDDNALSITPTFSIYRRAAEARGSSCKVVPLKRDFSLDVDNILALISSKTKIIFLCSPNNPTANQFNIADIRSLLEGFKGILVIDEAYVEFSDESALSLLDRFPNLVILRTFSKAFGLANLRLGYLVSNPNFASILNDRFQMPYMASSIALRMGIKMLNRNDMVKIAISQLKKERNNLISRINKIEGLFAFESKTSFVLIHLQYSSKSVYESLLKKGIIVRNLGEILHLKDCIRISIAPTRMMNRFLETIKEIIGDNND